MTGKIQTGHAIRGESLMNATKKNSIVLKYWVYQLLTSTYSVMKIKYIYRTL